MSVWDGWQETWDNLWTGIQEAWGGATATPEELDRIDDALGEDYNAVEDFKNAAEDMAATGAEAAAKAVIPDWVVLVVIGVFALVIFDN